MRLKFTRRIVGEAPIGSIIPARAAAKAALAGKPRQLTLFFARAIKRRFVQLGVSEAEAGELAYKLLSQTDVVVEAA